MADDQQCPICDTITEVGKRSWFHTCRGCGSGINMIGIWWKDKTGEDWLELSQEKKIVAGDSYFSRTQDNVRARARDQHISRTTPAQLRRSPIGMKVKKGPCVSHSFNRFLYFRVFLETRARIEI